VDLQRRLVDLSSEVEDIHERTTRRAEEESERILADARATAERIRNDAQAAIDQELRRAKAELRDEAATIALELAAQKLSDNVSDADRERLMDEFITRVEPSTTAGQGANS
jgi:F-type H+-transporting ATPase subunit b